MDDDPLEAVDDEQVADVLRRDGRVDERDDGSHVGSLLRDRCYAIAGGNDGTSRAARFHQGYRTSGDAVREAIGAALYNPPMTERRFPTRSATRTNRPAPSSSPTPTSRSSARSASRRPSTAPSARAAALLDLPQRGVLELTGKDRLPFLNNLLTNQTWDKATKTGLAAGQGVYAYYLNAKGRIVADMNVLELGDGRTLLEMDGRMVEPVRAAFDKYLFVEQVKMTEPGRRRCTRSRCSGPRARGRAGAGRGAGTWASCRRSDRSSTRIFDTDVVVFRDDAAGVPGLRPDLRRRGGRARSG